MKKYKLRPVNSYYFYKKKKSRARKRLLFVCSLICVVFIGICINDEFGQDLITFFPFLEQEAKGPQKDVYLPTTGVKYDLYKAPKKVKGIYIPPSKVMDYENYISMARETGINSFIIDVKNDNGYLTFATDNEVLIEKGVVLAKPPMKDVSRMMTRLYEEGIYPIARVVAFKDNVVAKKEPERAIKSLSGQIYETSAGDTWLDPYNKANWDYLLEICDEAVKLGFKEIQFDYVRFHESMKPTTVVLDETTSKADIITAFTKYACQHLQQKGVYVSADVFGAVILSQLDASIVGQDFAAMSQYLDYICPMVYPSHYAEGTFGIAYPHLDAYDIILNTMEKGQDLIRENERSQRKAIIRPWLQDFTLKSLKPYLLYGPEQIKAQIQGTYDAGLEEWIFWNAAGNYTVDGYK